MRILFIKNSRQRNWDNPLLLVFLGELLGSLLMILLCKMNMFKLDVYSNYFISTINNINVDKNEYFIYCFFRFIKEMLFVMLITYTNFSKLFKKLYIIYISIRLSISLCTCVLLYGILGQIKFLLYLFPGTIIFYGFMYLYCKKEKNGRYESQKGLIKKMIITVAICTLFCALLGILETYVNLKIVKLLLVK